MRKPKNTDTLKMRKSRRPTATLYMLWARGRSTVIQAQGPGPPRGRQKVESQDEVRRSLCRESPPSQAGKGGIPRSPPWLHPPLAELRQKQSLVGDPGEM